MPSQRARRGMGLATGLLLAVALACAGPTPAAPTPTPTLGPNLTGTAESDAVATALIATLEAVALTGTAGEVAGATATEVAATEAAIAASTGTRVAQSTAAADRRATRTALAAATLAQATVQAQPLASRVEQLVADGQLTRSAGVYTRLDDYEESWAQINWYQWRSTGYAPSDFVVRADFSWDSASNTANWFNSGCGFVFREASRTDVNHYLVYLGLDGIVYFLKARLGQLTDLASAKGARLDVPSGAAQFMLVVEGDRFTAFVNDQRVITAHDSSYAGGELNYTMLSGTNRDFGTSCHMQNVELWTLDPP